ncbi:hypothetical protein [Fibrobacter sp.]|uniref:hypothetical protein n=1 Tax=Fibrobacter sp. TaxID=35828 RepID=UPI003865289C
MDEEKVIDPRYIERLRSLPKSNYDDKQDAMAQAMAGHAVFHPDSPFVSIEARSHVNTKCEIKNIDDFIQATGIKPNLDDYRNNFDLFKDYITRNRRIMPGTFNLIDKHKGTEIPHVDIPRKPDIFKPTKSMLDILSERIDSDLNKRLTEFGKTNGFPVVFVFYQTIKDEDGVSKATCDIRMFKFEDKTDARLFALQTGGEFGIFDPRSKDEQIKDLEKKVKRLEEDRDYWKREAEGDDDDTLGIFKHWDD